MAMAILEDIQIHNLIHHDMKFISFSFVAHSGNVGHMKVVSVNISDTIDKDKHDLNWTCDIHFYHSSDDTGINQ